MLNGLATLTAEGKSKRNKLMMKLLNYCLDWLRDEIVEEPIAIIVTPKHRHKIIKLNQSVLWMPEKIEPTVRSLKLTQFLDFENPHRVTLKGLKRLMRDNLPECEIGIDKLDNGIKVVRIVWPIDVDLSIDKDIILTTNRMAISPTQSLVTLLTYKPDWISAGYTKSKDSFYKRLPLGFEKKQLVVYEGMGATYIFNNKGLDYLHTQKLEDLKENKHFIECIPHISGYDNWRKIVGKYCS